MIKKQTIKLSKELLLNLALLKNSQSDSVNLMPEYKDYSKCSSSCPFYNKNNNICNNCVFILSTSSIIKKRADYLTHSQIKQLLFYISTIFENNGMTIELTHEYVAKSINCSIRTVRDNITQLTEAGYIVATSIKNNKYKVFVKDFNKYYQKKSRGYFYISEKCFNNLLKIDNINTLRVALTMLVKLDDMKVSKASKISKKITYKSLINILPTNITCFKQIKQIILKLKNLFNIKFKEDFIEYSFKNDIDGSIYRNKINKTNLKAFRKLFKKISLKVSEEDMNDLLQLSLQYNIHTVLKVFNNIKNIPSNLGSYLRTIIKNNIDYLILK